MYQIFAGPHIWQVWIWHHFPPHVGQGTQKSWCHLASVSLKISTYCTVNISSECAAACWTPNGSRFQMLQLCIFWCPPRRTLTEFVATSERKFMRATTSTLSHQSLGTCLSSWPKLPWTPIWFRRYPRYWTKQCFLLLNLQIFYGLWASIQQIFDQYLNFVSLEEDLFVSRNQNTHEISYLGNF